MRPLIPLVLVSVLAAGCYQGPENPDNLAPKSSSYTQTATGQDITAYAMGNARGAGGPAQIEVVAVHPKKDTKPYRPILKFGSTVRISGEVTIPADNAVVRTAFIVRDLGDLQWKYHSGDPFWLDVYFGRLRKAGQPCSCSYSPGANAVCYEHPTINSCDAAKKFGKKSFDVTYNIVDLY